MRDAEISASPKPATAIPMDRTIARERSSFLRLWWMSFGVFLGLVATIITFPLLMTGLWIFWLLWIVCVAFALAVAYGSALVAWSLFAEPLVQRKLEAGGFGKEEQQSKRVEA